jgi:hypothetical protein
VGSVRFFEVLPRRLLKVTDADFEAWRASLASPKVSRSPDGFAIKRAHQVSLQSAELEVGEVASPEAGEACFVARSETLELIRRSGVTGLLSRKVVSKKSENLLTLDPEMIVSATSNTLAFGVRIGSDGCRTLDRPPILTLDETNSRAIEGGVALLPESRFDCSGTTVFAKGVVERLDQQRIDGFRYSPMLVVGDPLWFIAESKWAEFMNCINIARI